MFFGWNDKIKLDTVKLRAEENQNAFASVTSPSQPSIIATKKSGTLRILSSEKINLTMDPILQTLTIGLKPLSLSDIVGLTEAVNGTISLNPILTFVGDVTGSGSTPIQLTLANNGVVSGTYSKVTIDSTGRVITGDTLKATDIPVLNQNTTGNAAAATKLTTSRNIVLSGDVSGSALFDGTKNISIDIVVNDDSHLHSFDFIANKPTSKLGYGITDVFTKDEVIATIDSSLPQLNADLSTLNI